MLSEVLNKIKNLKIINKINRLPVTLKVTIWYTTFLFIFLSLFVGTFFFVSGSYAARLSEQELEKAVYDISTGKESYQPFEEGILLLIYDKQGHLLNGNVPTSFNVEVVLSKKVIREYINNDSRFIYLDDQITDGEYQGMWIRGVASMSGLENKLFMISIALLIMSPIVLIVISVGGYNIIKLAFKPVKRISQTAVEIGLNNDLSRRIDLGKGYDEIYQTGYAFNKMLDSLEKASKHEKQFVSDVSHELRTPISVILSESQYGEMHANSKEETDQSFQVITRQSKRMTRLINELLEISRMDRTTEIEKIRFNLSKLIQSIILDYRNLAESKDIILEDKIENNLYIYGNKLMIQRVFDNLFSNALKFTSSKITISLKQIHKKYYLTVQDDGPGITKENQSRIWERFFQTDSSRNKSLNKGFGLGLSMVKKIIELHQGEVMLESKEGLGSTFTVILDDK